MARLLNRKYCKEYKNAGFKDIAEISCPIKTRTKNVNLNRKETIMLVTNCCKAMERELAAWKATVYDIVRKMDKMPGSVKEKFLSNLEDLHILVEELDQRIENIRANCTPETGIDDIKTEREGFTYSLSELRVKAEDAMKVLSAGDFGG